MKRKTTYFAFLIFLSVFFLCSCKEHETEEISGGIEDSVWSDVTDLTETKNIRLVVIGSRPQDLDEVLEEINLCLNGM